MPRKEKIKVGFPGVEKVIVLGDQGPSGLVNKTVDIAAQAPALVKSLTGVDIHDLVGVVSSAAGIGEGESSKKTETKKEN